MSNYLKKNRNVLLMLSILLFLGIIMAVSSIVNAFDIPGTAETGFRTFNGRTSQVIYPNGHAATCIKNNSGSDFFVPTKYYADFQSFKDHLPSGVTLSCCGSGSCDAGESCSTCPSDCGSCGSCGDGECVYPETSITCPTDCPGCCLDLLQSPSNCTPQSCTLNLGANNYCFSYCDPGQGVSMFTKVNQDWIGSGAVGSTCRQRTTDQACGNTAHCGWLNALPKCNLFCGDGTCSSSVSENCYTCASDCGSCSVCGDSVCNGAETAANCPGDCGSVCTGKKSFECNDYPECIWLDSACRVRALYE